MADIYPLALNEDKEFFDAENIPIRNVGLPQLSTDAVSYGVHSKTAITNTSTLEELHNVLESYVDDKTIAQVLAEKILRVDNLDVTPEGIKKFNGLLAKKVDGKTIAEHFQLLQISDGPSPISNFYADSDTSSVIERSQFPLLSDIEKTYQEMFEKRLAEHKPNIVQELLDSLIKNTLTYHECCDILLHCSTKTWVKSSVQEYRFMKRAEDFFYDVKEVFFVFEYENGKYVMKSVTPRYLKPMLGKTNFSSVVIKSFDTNLDNLEINANTISGINKSEDKSVIKVSMIEGIFDLHLDLPLGTTSTIFVNAGISIKK